ncbi:MAG TPA: STAS domain-containing protein [Yinghuangia sp.]|uniref:STAS domain-containing protein n=1 Tax=Yinghuangia sp. YIM S10712 TaxID=3436930 RepID=UPI002CE139A9|nr:STAS domain-containing protein [Yinghuangia sp.]
MDLPHGREGSGPIYGSAVLEVTLLSDRRGIRASGEINAATRTAWQQALRTMAGQHEDVSFIDLSGVGFVDVAGVAALAVTALTLPGGRVVVEHPPPQLPRVLDMFWPEMRRIEVAP